MEIKLIMEGIQALAKLNHSSLKLKTALDVMRNTEECQKVVDLFESRRKELVAPLGDDPENADEALQAEVIEKINKLLGEEVEVTIKKLPMSQLAEVEISAGELFTIMWMIDEDA